MALRIKDNVDLKELKRFGFAYDEIYDSYSKEINLGIYYVTIRVFLSNPNFKHNEITCQSSICYDTLFDDNRLAYLITDLIQAGLVEKVEEAKWNIKDKECY